MFLIIKLFEKSDFISNFDVMFLFINPPHHSSKDHKVLDIIDFKLNSEYSVIMSPF